MENSQRGTNSDTSNATSAPSNLMPNVLFREIHKNAFLKKHSSDRRAGFPRKSERVWVVFCVHDDIEPFLEIYPDQKVALTHKPEWFASLSNVLHVSPTICGHEDEYEFAITLSFQVVRLSAPSWECMMEWVETIRNKLRELKVLCPKENIYSKMPEQKQPLLPTRDPNSPLPLPPEGPSALLPGVELVHLESRINLSVTEGLDHGRHQRITHTRCSEQDRRVLNKRVTLPEREGASVLETSQPIESSSNGATSEDHLEGSTTSDVQSSKSKDRRAPSQSSSSSIIPADSNVTVIEVSTSVQSSSNFTAECNPCAGEDEMFSNPSYQNLNDEAAAMKNVEEAHYEHVFLSNVPHGKVQCKTAVNCLPVNRNKHKKTPPSFLIDASSSTQSSSQNESVTIMSNLNLSNNSKDLLVSGNPCTNVGRDSAAGECETSEKSPLSPKIPSKLEKVNIAGLIPRVPAKSSKVSSFKPLSPLLKDLNLNVLECKRHSFKSECNSTSGTDDPGAITNGECSREATANEISTPTYSLVKKISKGKAKNDDYRSEEHHLSQKASSVISKRKVTEIQVVEVNSHGSRKSENAAICQRNNLSEAKVSSNIILKTPSSKKQDSGESGNSNNETTRKLGAVSNSDFKNAEVSSSGPSTSGNTNQINLNRKDSFTCSNNNSETEPIISIVQPAVGVISVEDIPLIGGHQRRRRRSSSSELASASNVPSSRGIGGADRIRINIANNSAAEAHRNEGETRSSCRIRNTTEPNSHFNITSLSSRLTLREKQVLQLKKEMLHPGGVRLQLRRKDCTGSIALVDVLNGVWIAGWKQKEHPLLYNALHIGDQLISIGDALVRNSTEAQKLIRSSTGLHIEFIIRRVPFGNVFALQRSSEGQSLGIMQEGNTAEIKEVIPNSVAARQGLTSKTPSCDGLSLTTWFLTEINGRPLNLFFKDNEVRDRLNAVGKEISILVQPYDFIKQIRKQLKNIKSYKDYIVQ